MNGSSKIDRLIRLILLLQQDRAGNAPALAEQLGVKRRAVHRYFEVLDGLGVPWYFDDESQRYRMGPEFFLPPTQLTASESLALIALVDQVAGRGQVPLMQPAVRAIEKIRGRLDSRVLQQLDDPLRQIDIRLAAASDATDDALQGVRDHIDQAIHTGRKLRCRYESLNPKTDSHAWFGFAPYAVCFDQRCWYAVGEHDGRGEVRCLKLTRFVALEPTDEPYTVPEDFSLEDFRGLAWRMIRGGRVHDVAIRFNPPAAETVAETHWHPTQEIEYHDDGAITFRCRVDGLDEIAHFVISYGPMARVLEPPELVQRVASMAKATAELYARPD